MSDDVDSWLLNASTVPRPVDGVSDADAQAIAAEARRLVIAVRAEASRERARLPVIVTCGACSFCIADMEIGDWCDRDDEQRDVSSAEAPPEWCPLRGSDELRGVGQSLADHAAAGLTAPEPAWMELVRQAYRLGYDEGSAGHSPMTADVLDAWISVACEKRGGDVR